LGARALFFLMFRGGGELPKKTCPGLGARSLIFWFLGGGGGGGGGGGIRYR